MDPRRRLHTATEIFIYKVLVLDESSGDESVHGSRDESRMDESMHIPAGENSMEHSANSPSNRRPTWAYEAILARYVPRRNGWMRYESGEPCLTAEETMSSLLDRLLLTREMFPLLDDLDADGGIDDTPGELHDPANPGGTRQGETRGENDQAGGGDGDQSQGRERETASAHGKVGAAGSATTAVSLPPGGMSSYLPSTSAGPVPNPQGK